MDIYLTCRNCGEKLINIVQTEDNESRQSRSLKPLKQKVIAKNCPHCSIGGTFSSKVIEGTVFIGSVSDNIELFLESTDVIDDIIRNEFTLNKKNNNKNAN